MNRAFRRAAAVFSDEREPANSFALIQKLIGVQLMDAEEFPPRALVFAMEVLELVSQKPLSLIQGAPRCAILGQVTYQAVVDLLDVGRAFLNGSACLTILQVRPGDGRSLRFQLRAAFLEPLTQRGRRETVVPVVCFDSFAVGVDGLGRDSKLQRTRDSPKRRGG